MELDRFSLFDSHLHIIDPRFALIENQGYLPPSFTVADYRARMRPYDLVGGAVVSGSFQGFDQTYLIDALRELGPAFVGVTQIPFDTTDQEIHALHSGGVRAVRFNLKRGGSEDVRHLDRLARRVHELVGWHAELYVDAQELDPLTATLIALPAVSVDHLGLSKAGFSTLLRLVESGVHVKATGFSRTDLDVSNALRALYATNPHAVIFGTDLPSTRAPRIFDDVDFRRVIECLGEAAARRVLCENALEFYKVRANQSNAASESP